MSAPSTGKDYAICSPDRSLNAPGVKCVRHGGSMTDTYECVTVDVLADVRAERARQFAQYGTNANLEDGTGPETRWLQGLDGGEHFPAHAIAADLRAAYEDFEAETGKPTWVHLVLEEVAEAFTESDPVRLREELIQVAALAVSWVEKLDERQ